MEGIDMEEDTFYYCTEVSPRCFVIQRAITFDRGQIERMVGELEKTQPAEVPPPPQMPYWFNTECRNQLVNNSSLAIPVAPSPVPILSPTELKQQLKAQLEYYFSRENLVTDKYLRCQMDQDQYVPISIIAGFRKITQLTNDYNLVLEALRESNQVEVDEKGEKVRPASRRCTIILREISEEHKADVERMLSGGPSYLDLKYGLNDSWYVIYENEETTQKAYLHIQNLDSTFNNKPICARIKAGGPPSAELPLIERAPTAAPDPLQSEPLPFTPLMELGQLLASYGYVSAGVYTPDGTGGVQEEEIVQQANYRNPVRNTHSPRPHNGYHGSNGFSNNYQNGYGERRREIGRRNTGPSFSGQRRTGLNQIDRSSMAKPWTTGITIQFVYTGRYFEQYGISKNDMHLLLQKLTGEALTKESRKNLLDFTDQRRNTGESRPRRSEYWNSNQRDLPSPSMSVSANDLHHIPPERPRYNSFRREEGPSNDFLTVPHRRKPWESTEQKTDEDLQSTRKNSENSTAESSYSFEEKSFPSLSDPKPAIEKPTEKPSFSCVAAGRRYAKPEPKKSYAEKLKQGGKS